MSFYAFVKEGYETIRATKHSYNIYLDITNSDYFNYEDNTYLDGRIFGYTLVGKFEDDVTNEFIHRTYSKNIKKTEKVWFCFYDEYCPSNTIKAYQMNEWEYCTENGDIFDLPNNTWESGLPHYFVKLEEIKWNTGNKEIQTLVARHLENQKMYNIPKNTIIGSDKPWEPDMVYPDGYIADFKPTTARQVADSARISINNALKRNKEKEMNLNIVFTKTVYTINGNDVSEMREDQLLGYVSDLEDNLHKLQSLSSESKYITKKIAEQKKTLKVVISHLDKNAGKL